MRWGRLEGGGGTVSRERGTASRERGGYLEGVGGGLQAEGMQAEGGSLTLRGGTQAASLSASLSEGLRLPLQLSDLSLVWAGPDCAH